MILLPLIEEDFNHSEPIIAALVRQRAHYPIIEKFLTARRNGIEYVTMYGDIYELRIRDYIALKNRVPKLYYLEYQGNSRLTLSQFWNQLDYCTRTYSVKHFLDDSFWDYWKTWLEKKGN